MLKYAETHFHAAFVLFFIKIAAKLVDAASSIEVTDSNSMRQATSTISALAATTSDMPRAAQEKFAEMIGYVSRTVQTVSETASKDDSVNVGKMVLDVFFGVMNVSPLSEFENEH